MTETEISAVPLCLAWVDHARSCPVTVGCRRILGVLPCQIRRSGVRLCACPTASHHTAALCTDIAGRFPVIAFGVLFAQQIYYSTERGNCQVGLKKYLM